jgi:hypothetical protein
MSNLDEIGLLTLWEFIKIENPSIPYLVSHKNIYVGIAWTFIKHNE